MSDGRVAVWELEKRELLSVEPRHSKEVVFVSLPDSAGPLVSCDVEGELRDGTAPAQKLAMTASAPLQKVAADPRCRVVAHVELRAAHWFERATKRTGQVVAHRSAVPMVTIAVSPDGTKIAIGEVDGGLQIWDRDSGQEARRLPGMTGAVRALAWSSDGAQIAAADERRGLKVYDARSGTERQNLSGTHYGFVISANSDSEGTGPKTFERLQSGKTPAKLRILRNGVLVREQDVTLPTKRVVLRAAREGDSLVAEVLGQPSVSFRDVFPLAGSPSGSFAVLLPCPVQGRPGASVGTDIAGERESPREGRRSVCPGSLRGGVRFLPSASVRVGRIRRRRRGAMQIGARSRRLAAERGSRRGTRQGRQRSRRALAARGRDSALADSRSRRALGAGERRFRGDQGSFFGGRHRRLHAAGRAKSPHPFLPHGHPPVFRRPQGRRADGANDRDGRCDARLSQFLLRLQGYALAVHWIIGDPERARDLARSWFTEAETHPDSVDRYWLELTANMYGWLEGRHGNADEAFRRISVWYDRFAALDPEILQPVLTMELAYLHMAAGRRKECERLLDRLIGRPAKCHYNYYSQACLLKGFLHLDDGDEAKAKAVWHEGTRSAYVRQKPGRDARDPLTGSMLLNHYVLASLSGELDEAEAARIFAEYFTYADEGSPLAQSMETREGAAGGAS